MLQRKSAGVRPSGMWWKRPMNIVNRRRAKRTLCVHAVIILSIVAALAASHERIDGGQKAKAAEPLPSRVLAFHAQNDRAMVPRIKVRPAVNSPGLYALPACYSQQDLPAEEPTSVTFEFCGDGGAQLERMTWTAWNPQSAEGQGIFSLNNCQPTCVEGTWLRYPTQIHAAVPTPAQPDSGCPPDTQFYSQLILAFPAATPNSDGQGINSQYGGLPAITFSTEPNAESAKVIGQPTCR